MNEPVRDGTYWKNESIDYLSVIPGETYVVTTTGGGPYGMNFRYLEDGGTDESLSNEVTPGTLSYVVPDGISKVYFEWWVSVEEAAETWEISCVPAV